MYKKKIKFIDYAGNDFNKWKKILGFIVIHDIDKIGRGQIIKISRKKGDILFTINFKNNTYDDTNTKIFKPNDLEKYCHICGLEKIDDFLKFVKLKNGSIELKENREIIKSKNNKDKKYNSVSYNECIVDRKLLNDKTYKDESIKLSKTLNYLYKKISNLQYKINALKEACEITFSPNKNEMIELSDKRNERRRYYIEQEKIERIYDKPYFGRVTITDYCDNSIDIYIGESEVRDGDKTLVWDWRSELGQRYYKRNEVNFKLNGLDYTTSLIRTINIKNGILQKVYNEYLQGKGTYLSISDPFLQHILKEKRNQKELTNIISSIQENQNKIITTTLNENVILQGCAGSGKTMILLHKLSYLVYNNKNIDIRRIKIITPNNLFKLSINNLSKELQIDKIDKFCIEEYYIDKLREYGFNLRSKISNSIENNDMLNFVYSEYYIELLKKYYDNYINELWSIVYINRLDNIMKANGIECTFLGSYWNLQYKIRRLREELVNKNNELLESTKEIKKLKGKEFRESKIIELLKIKKKLLISLDTILEQKKENSIKFDNEIESFKNNLNVLAGRLKISSTIDIEQIENLIRGYEVSLDDYDKIKSSLELDIKNKQVLEKLLSLINELSRTKIFQFKQVKVIKSEINKLLLDNNLEMEINKTEVESRITEIEDRMISHKRKIVELDNKKKQIVLLTEFKELKNKEIQISTEYLMKKLNLDDEIESLCGQLKLERNIEIKEVKSEIDYTEKSLKEIYETKDKMKSLIERVDYIKKNYFLNRDIESLLLNVNEIVDLTGDDLTFLDVKVYSAIEKELSRRFDYNNYALNTREKLFSLLNLIYLHKGKLTKSDKFIYFDEGQDISYYEYSLISKINGDTVVLNIFGDVNQVITRVRGISNWSDLNKLKKFKKFTLDENYRNPKKITEYCIDSTGYKMTPVGVEEGQVYRKFSQSNSIDKIISKFISDLSMRKVVIVKVVDDYIRDMIKMKIKESEIHYVSDDNKVNWEKINVLTVKMAKGMEFDAVLVITKGMNNNEKYIALTRAMVNLYIC